MRFRQRLLRNSFAVNSRKSPMGIGIRPFSQAGEVFQFSYNPRNRTKRHV
jgi:hypothetical protein